MVNVRHTLLRVMVVVAIWAAPASAQEVLLTLTGAVKNGRVEITRADLEALPQHAVETSTSVTDGRPLFEGALMRDVLAFADAQGDSVRAMALNDYVFDIPVEDFHRYDVLAALSMDGQALTARDKGPIWIIYPRDDHPELDDIRYDMRWVWQLVALHVE